MKLSAILPPENVVFLKQAKNKEQVIRDAAAKLCAESGLQAETIATALLKREALGSTAMGDGVALPHAKFQGLKHAMGCLVRLGQPIDFQAIDGKPVDVVFVLLLPAEDGGNLGALAGVARRLRAVELLSLLRTAGTEVELHTRFIGERA
jgi:PTS system nitrogen regulatory IIA component